MTFSCISSENTSKGKNKLPYVLNAIISRDWQRHQHSLLDVAIARKDIPLVALLLQHGDIVATEYMEKIDKKLNSKKEETKKLFALLKQTYDEPNCIICFEHYDKSDEMFIIPCEKPHTEFICKECHKQLTLCPLCRSAFPSS